jgi:hypothetical protein
LAFEGSALQHGFGISEEQHVYEKAQPVSPQYTVCCHASAGKKHQTPTWQWSSLMHAEQSEGSARHAVTSLSSSS